MLGVYMIDGDIKNFTPSFIQPAPTDASPNIKGHTAKKWKSMPILSSKENIILMKIKSAWYEFKALLYEISSKKKSQFYSYKSNYLNQKIRMYEKQDNLSKKFGAAFRSGALNIVEDKYSYNEFKSAFKEKEKSFNVKNEEQPFILTGGICKAISIDLADRFLNKGASIQELAAAVHKGADLNVEKMQSDYANHTEFRKKSLSSYLFSIANKKHYKEEKISILKEIFSEADQDQTKFIENCLNVDKLINIQKIPGIENKIPTRGKCIFLIEILGDYTARANDEDKHLTALIATVLVHNPTLIQTGKEGKTIVDYPKLQRALFQEIEINFNERIKNFKQIAENNIEKFPEKKELHKKIYQNQIMETIKLRNQLRQEFKIAIASKNAKYDAIEDAQIGILQDLTDQQNVKVGERIAKERGIDLIPMNEKMGAAFEYSSDAKYLERLHNLDPGFYTIGLNLGSSGHAISLIILEDKSGCLIDPNYGSFAFEKIDEGREIMEKLLKFYSSRKLNDNFPTDNAFHNLRFFRCEKSQQIED